MCCGPFKQTYGGQYGKGSITLLILLSLLTLLTLKAPSSVVRSCTVRLSPQVITRISLMSLIILIILIILITLITPNILIGFDGYFDNLTQSDIGYLAEDSAG